MNEDKEFSIGCDPEFVCTDRYNTVMTATNYVPQNGRLGVDGNGVTFEVRPDPSYDPFKVVECIHEIFFQESLKREILMLDWYSDSCYKDYPLGGHIHFGFLQNKIDYEKAAHLLDNYLGSISLLIENQTSARNRRSKGYGYMGDWRSKNHGFEYRTISSWLVSPHISCSILCLAKTIIYELLENENFFKKSYFSFKEKDIFSKVQQYPIKQKFSLIWYDITKMNLYKKYKIYIDLIYFLIKNDLTWCPRASMKEVWGLRDLRKIDVMNKVDLDIIWYKYRKNNQ